MDSGQPPTAPPRTARGAGGKESFGHVIADQDPSRDQQGDGSSSQGVNPTENEGTSGNNSPADSSVGGRLGDVTSLTESEHVTETGSPTKGVESQPTRPDEGDVKQISNNLQHFPDESSNPAYDTAGAAPWNAEANRNKTGEDADAVTESLGPSLGDNSPTFKCPFSDQGIQAPPDETYEGPPTQRGSSTSGAIPHIPDTHPHETELGDSSETSWAGLGHHDLAESKTATDSSSDTDPSLAGEDIVVVTGGNGFFGQHIVKMLQLRAPHVKEIWVLDITPFEQKLDYQPTKKVKSITGSVTDAKFVAYSLQGATSVIHVAGVISWGTFPDLEGMEKVNVKGTLNVLNACLKNNVQRLIYCSTVDVAIGGQPIRGGDEASTPVPDKFLFPGYPDTKYHGERLILGSGHPRRADGGQLQTTVLRANVCYGELDEVYVTHALRSANKNKGVLYQVGDGSAMFQQAYVGNTAWAFVCADSAMRDNPELSNEIFYIPDNTPIQNTFNFIRPYLEARGFQLSPRPINFPMLHGAVSLAEVFVKGLSPLVKLSLPFQSYTLAYINTDLYFSGSKARRVLNFDPIYSPNEARLASMKYYTTVDLDGGPTT